MYVTSYKAQLLWSQLCHMLGYSVTNSLSPRNNIQLNLQYLHKEQPYTRNSLLFKVTFTPQAGDQHHLVATILFVYKYIIYNKVYYNALKFVSVWDKSDCLRDCDQRHLVAIILSWYINM